MYKFMIVIAGLLIFFTGCSSSKNVSGTDKEISVSSLQLLGKYVYPHGVSFKNAVVGGLSSIDYDAARNVYYLICDDPSVYGPARYYTAAVFFTQHGIDSVQMLNMTPLLDTIGRTYPDIRKDRFHSLDAESMRYNPVRDELVYASEGQRVKNKNGTTQVQNPVIIAANRNGRFKDSFALPQNLYLRTTENGPRHNGVFEGLTFSGDYKHMYVNVEEPLYEDGPRAATGDTTSWIRIAAFSVKLKKQLAQYAYQTDAVPYAAMPAGAFKINGVSDILWLGNNRFLVTERAYITGRATCYIRFYIADIKDADNIASVQSLIETPPAKPAKKKLLFNMEITGEYVDNIEGVTIGPALPNGHRTLIAVADNNFSEKQQSQFWLFEIIP